jgi:hypothetical protein
MKINGNDLILLGLCFGIASTIILSKGYIFKDIDAIRDESASYFGANPYAVRNKIIQKWEGVVGFSLIIPFLIFQLLGIYLSVLKPKNESILLGSPVNLIFLILLTTCIIWGSSLISGTIARHKYIPILKGFLKEGFSQTEFVLKNDGLYDKEQNRSQEINREIRDKRLADMEERLVNWERLFNFKRLSKETDIDYFLRLKEYLDNY